MSNILIVEDDTSNRALISLQLEDVAAEVVSVGNGAQALARVRATRPDVVVLDLNMPVMDGFEFLRELKRISLQVPVVVVSAMYLDADHHQMLRDHGVVRVFEKGVYRVEDLETCVGACIGGA